MNVKKYEVIGKREKIELCFCLFDIINNLEVVCYLKKNRSM